MAGSFDAQLADRDQRGEARGFVQPEIGEVVCRRAAREQCVDGFGLYECRKVSDVSV